MFKRHIHLFVEVNATIMLLHDLEKSTNRGMHVYSKGVLIVRLIIVRSLQLLVISRYSRRQVIN